MADREIPELFVDHAGIKIFHTYLDPDPNHIRRNIHRYRIVEEGEADFYVNIKDLPEYAEFMRLVKHPFVSLKTRFTQIFESAIDSGNLNKHREKAND